MLRLAPGTSGLQQLPVLQRGNIWIAIRDSQWQSGADTGVWWRATVPMATADWSRGRAQQKIAQLFL